MPSPIDEIFEGALQLSDTPLPLEKAESLQPATVANVGELGSGGDIPAKTRLHDSEIAMLIDAEPMETLDDIDPATIPVRVTQIDGSAGNETSQCSFTYNVWNLREEVLGNSINIPMTPERPRPALGEMVAPSERAFGIGFFDEDDNFVLWDVGEVQAVEICT